MRHMQVRLFIGAALAVAAWAESPALPIKGVLRGQSSLEGVAKGADRSVSVVLKLYDQEFGGTLLFEERQTVQVDEAGIFVAFVGTSTKGGVPARITDRHATLWGDFALASTAFINTVNGRQQITHRREGIGANAFVFIPTSTTLCFSCGGSWPVFQGSFPVPFFSFNVQERGSLCSGSPSTSRSDSRPFLCARD